MERLIEKLKRLGAKRVFVQFAEGLTLKIEEIVERLEKEGFEVVVCLETTFGACDVRDEEAVRLGCDAILHIGHSDFGVKSKIPVVYWEYFIEFQDVEKILEENFGVIKNFEKVGIVASLQFVKLIPSIKNFLEKRGKKVIARKKLKYEGQILGCNLSAAKEIEKEVDCFLVISAGKFYGLGLTLNVKKPVFCLELEKKKIYSLEKEGEKLKKIIAWNLASFKDAKKVGILVSWKKGQFYPKIFEISKKIEKLGKEVLILAMDEIKPEKLEGLKLDILINTACPRIGIDDLERFKIPVINLSDLKID